MKNSFQTKWKEANRCQVDLQRKKNVKENVERYKARLMRKSYSKKHEIDYDEVFAPIARLKTIRLIIVIAAQHR
jgi:hypothetical protein